MATINITKDSPSNINISGVWTWHDFYTVTYSWSGAPEGVSLPTSIKRLKSGDVISVDSSYSNESEVDKDDSYYTFSGWDKSGDITVNSNVTITGEWLKHSYLSVNYIWTEAPSGVTLPTSVGKLKPGANVTVDTTYTSSSIIDGNNSYYTFSGWSQSGNITVNDNTTITGAWTAHNYLTVSYSWTNAPSGVSLPSSTGKLKPGNTVTVDTTYTANKQVDVGNKYYIFGGWNKSGNVTVTDSNIMISGIWTAYDYYSVTYSWSNAPSDVTLPSNKTKLKSGAVVAVDTTYTSNSYKDFDSNYYTFSGWNKSGNITVTGNVAISGSWTAHNYLTVSYSWTNAPSGVSLPSSKTKLKPGATVAVDTTYTANKQVDVGNQYYIFGGWNKSGNITVTGNTTISGAWTAHNYYSVSYSWSGAPSGVSLPGTVSKLKSGAVVTVNSSYTSNTAKKDTANNCYYQFSGWNRSGNITVNNNINISGSWTYHGGIGNWTEANLPVDICIGKMTYGNGKYVAISSGYNATLMYYSSDGINWNYTSNVLSANDICYGNGKFVAIGCTVNANTGKVTYGKNLAYSTDGINWTSSATLNTRNWYSICYGNGKFVAIYLDPNYHDFAGAYSTDGANWSYFSYSTYTSASDICYGNDKFVATTNGGATTTTYIYYSTDGINWTTNTSSITLTSGYGLSYLCYGNGMYIATTHNIAVFYYSYNGISWFTTGNGLSRQAWIGIFYGNGKWMATIQNSNILFYSTDGINWTTSTISSTSRWWNNIFYANNKFIASASYNAYIFAYMNDFPSNLTYI